MSPEKFVGVLQNSKGELIDLFSGAVVANGPKDKIPFYGVFIDSNGEAHDLMDIFTNFKSYVDGLKADSNSQIANAVTGQFTSDQIQSIVNSALALSGGGTAAGPVLIGVGESNFGGTLTRYNNGTQIVSGWFQNATTEGMTILFSDYPFIANSNGEFDYGVSTSRISTPGEQVMFSVTHTERLATSINFTSTYIHFTTFADSGYDIGKWSFCLIGRWK